MYEDEPAEEEIAEDEWDSREGDAWEQFKDGYLLGWESVCDIAFEGSPDGSVYQGGATNTPPTTATT